MGLIKGVCGWGGGGFDWHCETCACEASSWNCFFNGNTWLEREMRHLLNLHVFRQCLKCCWFADRGSSIYHRILICLSLPAVLSLLQSLSSVCEHLLVQLENAPWAVVNLAWLREPPLLVNVCSLFWNFYCCVVRYWSVCLYIQVHFVFFPTLAENSRTIEPELRTKLHYFCHEEIF